MAAYLLPLPAAPAPVQLIPRDSPDAYFAAIEQAIRVTETRKYVTAKERFNGMDVLAVALTTDARTTYSRTWNELVEWLTLSLARWQQEQTQAHAEHTIQYGPSLVNNYGIDYDPVQLAVDAFHKACTATGTYRVTVAHQVGNAQDGSVFRVSGILVRWGAKSAEEELVDQEAAAALVVATPGPVVMVHGEEGKDAVAETPDE